MKLLDTCVGTAIYATTGSAAFDICSLDKARLRPGQRKLLRTGLYLDTPFSRTGEALLILTRSGRCNKEGLIVLNAPGLVDGDYKQEIGIILANFGHFGINIEPGEKIAQGMVIQFAHMLGATITDVQRTGGFGSTGHVNPNVVVARGSSGIKKKKVEAKSE